ncbi:retropepsin-like aspartic protease [Glacieibacterium sp.]|uniref:retropepsin-like aspartic protease n=1 Tax=Glacieibacterium sp. TaxID=2860237 RepID=UPI003AFFFEE2
MTLTRRTLLAAATAIALIPAAAGQAATTQLRIVDDRIHMPVVVNGVTTEALLDSAAEMTVLDLGFARRLKLGGGRSVTARGTGSATTLATLVGGVRMRAAGLDLRPRNVAVIDLGDIARRLEGRIDVILGRDLFDAARLSIDLKAATLNTVARSLPPPGVRLPLVSRRGIETIPVTIEGHAAVADFDLGNGGRTLVGAGFAATHRLLADGRPTTPINGGGIGGEVRQTMLPLRTLDLAGKRFIDQPAVIDSNPDASDANIGVVLLRQFGIVTDFAQGYIWLDPRP